MVLVCKYVYKRLRCLLMRQKNMFCLVRRINKDKLYHHVVAETENESTHLQPHRT